MHILPQFLNKVIGEPSGPAFPGEHFPYPRQLDSHFHSFWRTQCLQGTPLNTPLRELGEQVKLLVLTTHHCPWNSSPLWASLKPPLSSTSFDPSSASSSRRLLPCHLNFWHCHPYLLTPISHHPLSPQCLTICFLPPSPHQKKTTTNRTSLVVQWLRLCTLNAGGLGSIPGQGTRSHMPQLGVLMLQLRPGAAKQKKKKKR